jgi:hypothetical protein
VVCFHYWVALCSDSGEEVARVFFVGTGEGADEVYESVRLQGAGVDTFEAERHFGVFLSN